MISIDDFPYKYGTDYNWYYFDYPINAIKKEIPNWRVFPPVNNKKDIEINIETLLDFENFDKVYYFDENEHAWKFVVQHINKLYICIEGNCKDYNDAGQGSVYYDDNPYDMYKYGISDEIKEKLNEDVNLEEIILSKNSEELHDKCPDCQII